MKDIAPIGIFDSGFGGLTVFNEIVTKMPQYDYLYFGDNARVPYGNRSFETVYEFTWECIQHMFDFGCPLVILACNTASAKALRTIQQKNLIHLPFTNKKVLGVIRPTTEIIGNFTESRNIGILATKGTVLSQSYVLEINKFFPDINVYQQACPMWVPIIENNEHLSEGADYFVKKYIDLLFKQCPNIDTIILACTHYPLLLEKIKLFVNENIKIIVQGSLVASSLVDYLNRHDDIKKNLSTHGTKMYLTTDDADDFNTKVKDLLNLNIDSDHFTL